MQNNLQSRRQTHASLQEKLNNLLTDIRLYEKGLKLFAPDVQQQLTKYLLKSLGTDVCNELCLYAAQECNLSYQEVVEVSAEQRVKIIQEVESEYKVTLQALNKTLSGSSLDDFLAAVENSLQACSMIVKKVDKKKDR